MSKQNGTKKDNRRQFHSFLIEAQEGGAISNVNPDFEEFNKTVFEKPENWQKFHSFLLEAQDGGAIANINADIDYYNKAFDLGKPEPEAVTPAPSGGGLGRAGGGLGLASQSLSQSQSGRALDQAPRADIKPPSGVPSPGELGIEQEQPVISETVEQVDFDPKRAEKASDYELRVQKDAAKIRSLTSQLGDDLAFKVLSNEPITEEEKREVMQKTAGSPFFEYAEQINIDNPADALRSAFEGEGFLNDAIEQVQTEANAQRLSRLGSEGYKKMKEDAVKYHGKNAERVIRNTEALIQDSYLSDSDLVISKANSEINKILRKEEITEQDRSRVAELKKQIRSIDESANTLFDPETGQFISGNEYQKKDATQQADITAFNDDVLRLSEEARNTPMDVLMDERREAYYAMKGAENLLRPSESYLSRVTSGTGRTTVSTLPEGEAYRREEREQDYRDAQKRFLALNRAVALNQDPAEVERGFGDIVSRFGEGLGFDKTFDDRDYVEKLTEVFKENGIELTEGQKERVRMSFGEELAQGAGATTKIGIELAVNAIIANKAKALLNIPKYVRAFQAMMGTRYGRAGRLVSKVLVNAGTNIEQGLLFEVSGGNFATGVGESLGEGAFTKMVDLITKGKGGKLLNRWSRIIGGTGGEIVGEYVGDFTSNLNELGIDNIEEVMDRTFGADMDEASRKLLLTSMLVLPLTGSVEVARAFKPKVDQAAAEYPDNESAQEAKEMIDDVIDGKAKELTKPVKEIEKGEDIIEEDVAETPAAETPTAETPTAETPAAETPAAETPAAETPAAETPAAETPAVETAEKAEPANPALADVESTAKALEGFIPDKKKFETEVAEEIGTTNKIEFVKIGNRYIDAYIKDGEALTGMPVSETTNPKLIIERLRAFYSDRELNIDDFSKEQLSEINEAISFLESLLTPKQISEAYHEAKKDGSNPELVKAVEGLLSDGEVSEKAAIEEEVEPKQEIDAEVKQKEGRQESAELRTEEEGQEVNAKNKTDLFLNARGDKAKSVKVVFKPAYDESKHSNLPENLKDELKKPKVSVFDISTDASDILELVDNPDVESIRYIKGDSDVSAGEKSQEASEPLRDVESTAKALDGVDEIISDENLSEQNKIIGIAEKVFEGIDNFGNADKLKLAELTGDKSNAIKKNKIAIEYAKAKLNRSNPELVQAVEELLAPKQPTDAIQEQPPKAEPKAEKPKETTTKKGEPKKQAKDDVTKEVEEIAKEAGVKATNIRTLYDINRKVWGLERNEALAAAVVQDRMIGEMARREGISKDKMYERIGFVKGGITPQGALLQEGAIWKSNAKDGVGKISQKSATPEQWVKMITDKGGRGTSQELEWIGLADFLNDYVKENKVKSVPKEVVEQYINDNQIEIVEVSKTEVDNNKNVSNIESLGGNYPTVYTVTFEDGSTVEVDMSAEYSLDEDVPRREIEQEALAIREDDGLSFERGENTPKYSDYTLEGGKNYREVLLTLPNNKFKKLEKLGFFSDEMGFNWLDKDGNVTELSKEAEAILNNEYNSGHWSEPNILAHLRINERTLPNGERVMFIEEVQSDWAQEGKKKGFRKNVPKGVVKVTGNDLEVRKTGLGEFALYYKGTDVIIDGSYKNETTANTILNDWIKNNRTFDVNLEQEQRGVDESVPQMPYKKTDQWVGMAMRRAMQMAVQEGFDRVAWVTGEQSAERYDLSKQVDRVVATKKPNEDEYRITIFEKYGNKTPSQLNLKAEELEANLGKDLAEKIINETTPKQGLEAVLKDDSQYQKLVKERESKRQEQLKTRYSEKAQGSVAEQLQRGKDLSRIQRELNQIENKIESYLNRNYKDYREKSNEYSGLDLKVGGEGMKAFYNSILPKVAKKEAQRFDKKANVEVVEINTASNILTQEDFDNRRKKPLPKLSKQLSIPITPEMRMNLNSAIPLFQGEQGAMVAEDGRFILYALTNPNVSTPLHEMAHVFEHYLTDAEKRSVLRWAGKKEWDTSVSEKFARGFEKYLAEGKSPIPSLQKIFGKFKEWLTNIYNGITGSDIDIELNQPMREIYASMLGEAAVKPKKAEVKSSKEAWGEVKDSIRDLFDTYKGGGILPNERAQAEAWFKVHQSLARYIAAKVREAIEAGLKYTKNDAIKDIRSNLQGVPNGNKLTDNDISLAYTDAVAMSAGEKPRFESAQDVIDASNNTTNSVTALNEGRQSFEKQLANGLKDWIRRRWVQFNRLFPDPNYAFRQVLKKTGSLLDKTTPEKLVESYMIARSGYSAKARSFANKYFDSIYGKLSLRERQILDEFIFYTRIVEVHQARILRRAEVRELTALSQDPTISKKDREKYAERAKVLTELGLNDVQHGFIEVGGKKVPLTADMAADWLASFDSNHPEISNEIRSRAKKYFDANRELLKERYEAGLITEQEYENLESYDYMRRVFDGVTEDLFTEDVASVAGGMDALRGIKEGSADLRLARNTQALLTMNALATYKAAEQNKFMNVVADFLGSKVEPEMAGKMAEFEQRFKNENGRKPTKDEIREYRALVYPMFVHTPGTKLPDGYQLIDFKTDGKNKKLAVSNEIANTFLSDTGRTISVPKAARTILNWITLNKVLKSAAVGLSPAFAVSDFFMNLYHFSFVSGPTRSFFANSIYFLSKITGIGVKSLAQKALNMNVKAVKGDTQFKKLSEDYIKHGGGFSGITNEFKTIASRSLYGKYRARKHLKFVKAVAATSSFIVSISETSEMSMRVTVYDTEYKRLRASFIKDKGRNPNDREITDMKTTAAAIAASGIDFRQGGDISKFLDMVLVFFNVAVQAARVELNNVRTKPLDTMLKFTEFGGLVFGYYAYMLLQADEDEKKGILGYSGVGDYDKKNYLIIMAPWVVKKDGKDVRPAFRLKLPTILRISNRLALEAASTYRGKQAMADPDLTKDLSSIIYKGYFPDLGLMPPTAQAAIAYNANFDLFKMKKIYTDKEMKYKPEEMYDPEKTKKLYRDIGMALGLKPQQLQVSVEKVVTSNNFFWSTLIENPYYQFTGDSDDMKTLWSEYDRKANALNSIFGGIYKFPTQYNRSKALTEDKKLEEFSNEVDFVFTQAEREVNALSVNYREQGLSKGSGGEITEFGLRIAEAISGKKIINQLSIIEKDSGFKMKDKEAKVLAKQRQILSSSIRKFELISLKGFPKLEKLLDSDRVGVQKESYINEFKAEFKSNKNNEMYKYLAYSFLGAEDYLGYTGDDFTLPIGDIQEVLDVIGRGEGSEDLAKRIIALQYIYNNE